MRKFPIATAGIAGVLAVGPVYAAAQTEPSQAENADNVTSATEVVCRRVAAPTGSRIGARNICRTRAEWDAINRDARNEMEDAQLRSKWCDNSTICG